jgi:hypothetical protein
MDTSEQYIKMCEKVPKFLEGWNDGDLYAYAINEPACPYRYTDVRMVHYCEDKPEADAIRVFRQDQLQEMYLRDMPDGTYTNGTLIFTLVEAFYGHFEKYGYPSYAFSMEQLWLAFAMKEKYNKTWNGEEWIDEST